MTDKKLRVAYHLAETVLHVSGTRTTQVSLQTGERVTVGGDTTEIVTAVEADPHDWLRVEPPESWLSDSKLTIELADDGRLLSVGSTSSGKASQAAKGLISFVTTAVGAAVGLGGPARGGAVDVPIVAGMLDDEEAPEPQPPAHVYPKSERIVQIDERLTALQDRQLELIDQLAGAQDAQARYAAASAVRLVSRAIDELRDELSLVLAHKQAWTEAIRNRAVETFDYRLRVQQLVADGLIENWPDDALPEEVAELGMVRDLDILVTRRDEQVHGAGGDTPGWDGSSEHGVWFRHPRRVELVVYRVDRDGESSGPKKYLAEVDRQVIQVVDDSCRHEFIPFDKQLWGDSSAESTFNHVGGLSTLTSDRTAAAAAAAATLGELPDTVKSALSSASGILESAAKVQDHAINREITRLENEKKLLETEIANETAMTTEYEQRRIAEINARKALLVAQKEFGDTAVELEVQRLGAGTDIAGQLATLRKTAVEAQRDAEQAAREAITNGIKAELSLRKDITELQSDIKTALENIGADSLKEQLDALAAKVEALEAQR